MKRLAVICAYLCCLASVTISQAALTDDLVGLYQFENSFSDTSVSIGINNGTPVNSPGFTAGKIGQAMNLTGFRDYMSLDPAVFSELDFGSTDAQDDVDFSVAMWVRQDDNIPNTDPAVFSNKDWSTGDNTGINWAVKGSGIFDLNTKGDTGVRSDLDTLGNSFFTPVGQWNLIVMTVDRDSATQLYINGVDRGTIPLTSQGSFDAGLPWNVGQDGTGSYVDEFTGAVDELSIWRRALAPGEADQIWNQGAGIDISGQLIEDKLKLVIDRDTGRMTIDNNTTLDQDIKGYSIVSQSGSLSQANWQTVTGRLDASGDQSVDLNDNWVVLTAPPSVIDLSEASLGTGTIVDGANIDLGSGIWGKYYQEDDDITFQYADGSSPDPIQGLVRFVGNNAMPYQFADLDFDGDLDTDDWTKLQNGFGTDLTDRSEAQRYRASDLDNDSRHTLEDILRFRIAFDQVNGSGAFEALLGNVPEPGSATLVSLVLLSAGLVVRGRRIAHKALIPLVCMMGTLLFGMADSAMAATVYSENFDSLILGPNVDETVSNPNAFTHTPPAGWNIVNNLPGEGEGDGVGVTEWEGWSFADRDWWASVDDQLRSSFTNASGTIAVADPDEWDDLGNPASLGTYNTFLSTGPIPVTGIDAGVLRLGFDSGWRAEGNQRVNVTVSYDGAPAIEVLRWTSTAGSDFHGDAPNEAVEIDLNNPLGANSAVLTFGMEDAVNNWYWAIDNVVVFTPVVLDVDVQSGAMTLQGDAGLALTGYEVFSPGGSLNASGWLQGNLDAQDIGNPLPPPADYSNNGTVDQADLAIWAGAFGLTNAGDGDGDGDSDGQDFLRWQSSLGATSAPGSTWLSFLATDEQLIESYLLGSSTFASDQPLGLGYNTVVDARDLLFTYTTASGESKVGGVHYVNTGGPVTAVPEPATCWLLVLCCLAAMSRRVSPTIK